MSTGLLLDLEFCEHDPGDRHLEARGRIRAIERELTDGGLAEKCRAIAMRSATDGELRLVHADGYVN